MSSRKARVELKGFTIGLDGPLQVTRLNQALGHDLAHARTEQRLPPHIRLAYDGLEIEVRGAGTLPAAASQAAPQLSGGTA